VDKITNYLASYSTAIKYEDLPPEVIKKTKVLLIDTLGCAMGGYSSEPSKIAREIAGTIYQCDMPATIIGSGKKSSPELATFANGVMIRYLDFNDHFRSLGGGHPSDHFACVLTVADAVHASGKDLILAVVLAYETFCRFSDQFNFEPKALDHSFPGVISSTMAVSRLLGLTREQMVQAINLAVTPNLTLLQTRVGTVSMWKEGAMANAGRNAIFAARLAKAGMTGPGPIFEGRYGLFNAITGPIQLDQFGGAGRPFRILEACIKCYPCGNVAQTSIDAAIALRPKISSVDEIAEINVLTFEHAKSVMAGDEEKWHPTTRETADHSIPYVVAVALMYGYVEAKYFEDAYIQDPALQTLIQKVKVTNSPEYDKMVPEASPARVEVVTKSGKRFSETVMQWRGYYSNPCTDEEIEQKFNSLSRDLLSSEQRKELLSLAWNIEQVKDAHRIMELLKV
jgi:2-methylcitrate dehydratase